MPLEPLSITSPTQTNYLTEQLNQKKKKKVASCTIHSSNVSVMWKVNKNLAKADLDSLSK